MFDFKLFFLLLSITGIFFWGCADSNTYNDGKDYYPVAASNAGIVYHWGKNNSIKVNTNSEGITFLDNQSDYVASFKSGLAQWNDTLSTIGITLEYVSSEADVNVKWVDGKTVPTGVLGYASTDKNITMTLTNNYTGDYHSNSDITFIAVHEFGHMLGIWSHSFDPNDIMYPLKTGPSTLSNRDKKTLSDFLYNLTPTQDMHDKSGPFIETKTGVKFAELTTYFTNNGCLIHSEH